MAYPTSAPALTTTRATGDPAPAADHNATAVEVNAIGGDLVTARGASANIAARLTAVDTAVAAKAPLASPALTGTPTAPTTSTGDSSTKIATTALVDAKVAAAGGGGADASTTVKGIAKLSTAPASPTDPIAVGTNDSRMTDARTPTAHTHPQSDVTNLTTDLAARVSTTGGGKETLSTNATAGATPSINLANGNAQNITLTANASPTFTGWTTGVLCSVLVFWRQNATGGWTTTWPAAVKWAGGVPPVLSTGASKLDVLSFMSIDNGTTIIGSVVAIDAR
jgi:hypothetical protein